MKRTSRMFKALLGEGILLFSLAAPLLSANGEASAQTVVATIPVGLNPWSVAVNPATNRVYTANISANNVSVVDGATNAVVATIPTLGIAGSTKAIAVNPTTNRIYVAHCYAGLSIIDGVTQAVVANVPIAGCPSSIAVNPVTNRIYAADAPAS